MEDAPERARGDAERRALAAQADEEARARRVAAAVAAELEAVAPTAAAPSGTPAAPPLAVSAMPPPPGSVTETPEATPRWRPPPTAAAAAVSAVMPPPPDKDLADFGDAEPSSNDDEDVETETASLAAHVLPPATALCLAPPPLEMSL